jgi:hypothetical protein
MSSPMSLNCGSCYDATMILCGEGRMVVQTAEDLETINKMHFIQDLSRNIRSAKQVRHVH